MRGAATTNIPSLSTFIALLSCPMSKPTGRRLGNAGGTLSGSTSESGDLSGRLGNVGGAPRGFLFGTGIGAVLVFLSGGGNGIPGGGSGCPLPIGFVISGVSSLSRLATGDSLVLCKAFNPHLLAVAAALVTADKLILFSGNGSLGVSLDLLEEEEDEVSRRSVPNDVMVSDDLVFSE